MTDIDRAFRYIQQFEPSLRGEKWAERQRKGGEISENEMKQMMKAKKTIIDAVKQLRFFA